MDSSSGLLNYLSGVNRILIVGAVPADPLPNTEIARVCEEEFECWRTLPFVEASFGALILTVPLGSFYDPFRIAAEIERLLAPHGILAACPVESDHPHLYRVSERGLSQLFIRFEQLTSDARWWISRKPSVQMTPARRSKMSFDQRIFNFAYDDIKDISDRLTVSPSFAPVLHEVLSWDSNRVQEELLSDGERGFPGEPRFQANGYYRMMLSRYLFAASVSGAADVLDTCCGLGWGTRIVAQTARHVTAFDRDQAAIAFCRQSWNAFNISWLSGDALDLAWLGRKRYDVTLAMETIEHFSNRDGITYIRQLESVLCTGGLLIGTSAFPETQEEARALESQNVHHLFIHTRASMLALLKEHFSRATVVGNWLFIAIK